MFQEQALDLRWLVEPGSVQSALITGMFGIQPEPTVGEVLVWLALRHADDDLRAAAAARRARSAAAESNPQAVTPA